MGLSSFRIYPVPEILKRDVECFIFSEFDSDQRVTINVFPSGIPGIVFHHKQGYPAIENIVTQSGRKLAPPTLFLHKAGIESSVMNFGKDSYTVMQVILKPHAVKSLFGIDALSLKDDVLELNELSAEDINERLIDAQDGQRRVALLTRFLAAKLEQQKTRDLLVEESLHLIHQCAGRIFVKRLLETLNISERQFERRFSQSLGISPISYIRVRRFNEAIRLMKSRQYNTLTEIAYVLDFHDQSHFIRDLKTFSGITPKNLAQRVEDFSHNQAGYSYI